VAGCSARAPAGGPVRTGPTGRVPSAAMEMRIDELAARTGVTSRNIRAYQAKGLLPAPRLEGRTGYYGEDHVQRLEMIEELSARGFSLAATKALLDAWAQGGDLADLIGFERLVAAPFTDAEPERMRVDDLLARFPAAAEDPALVERAVEEGLLEQGDGDEVTVPSPMLLEAGAELTRLGVPLADVLDLVGAIRSDVADIADRCVSLVGDHVAPAVLAGTPDPERLAELADTVMRLRAIALEVVRPFLVQELNRASTARLTALAEAERADAAG
jgi:DNA-binding transcriptional MerR regulator